MMIFSTLTFVPGQKVGGHPGKDSFVRMFKDFAALAKEERFITLPEDVPQGSEFKVGDLIVFTDPDTGATAARKVLEIDPPVREYKKGEWVEVYAGEVLIDFETMGRRVSFNDIELPPPYDPKYVFV
ncbi:MAG: hypothetical protein VX911_04375 [Candidatus Latescibacterota bacterium]|nr:hypothetical protein [Candidatus Latescibacterota bacterium]